MRDRIAGVERHRITIAACEHRAEARSVERVFTPRSMAVIGVSSRPGTFGHTIVRNAVDSGFTGEVYVVHPTAESIAGLREACEALETPVTGGNVSFYNESGDSAIDPTPAVP